MAKPNLKLKTEEPPQETLDLTGRRPKRREVGMIGNDVIYQLAESTGCMDCFRSIPEGSLVTIQNVSTNLCKIPVCMYFSKLDPANMKLTGKVEKSCKCSCPAFETGEVKNRESYAKKVREQNNA
jgi:hypothetical protein